MALTSAEYEARANRLRSQMGETVDELRSNLTPSNLRRKLSLAARKDIEGARLRPVATRDRGRQIGTLLRNAIARLAGRLRVAQLRL